MPCFCVWQPRPVAVPQHHVWKGQKVETEDDSCQQAELIIFDSRKPTSIRTKESNYQNLFCVNTPYKKTLSKTHFDTSLYDIQTTPRILESCVSMNTQCTTARYASAVLTPSSRASCAQRRRRALARQRLSSSSAIFQLPSARVVRRKGRRPRPRRRRS